MVENTFKIGLFFALGELRTPIHIGQSSELSKFENGTKMVLKSHLNTVVIILRGNIRKLEH